jgi:hypothetical protein
METVSQYEILQLHLECLKISSDKADSLESAIQGYKDLIRELSIPKWV